MALCARRRSQYNQKFLELDNQFDLDETPEFNPQTDQTTASVMFILQVREVRKYLRKMKYEIPLLAGMQLLVLFWQCPVATCTRQSTRENIHHPPRIRC